MGKEQHFLRTDNAAPSDGPGFKAELVISGESFTITPLESKPMTVEEAIESSQDKQVNLLINGAARLKQFRHTTENVDLKQVSAIERKKELIFSALNEIIDRGAAQAGRFISSKWGKRGLSFVGITGLALSATACAEAQDTIATQSPAGPVAREVEPIREVEPGLRPLTIEVAGKSISRTSPDNVWTYWRVENPNDQSLGYEIEFIEEGRLNLPEEDLAYLPEFEGAELTIRKDSSFTLRREEAPCNDANSRFLSMVPANGSVVIFFPPLLGGSQEASVRVKLDCSLGYQPTNEVVLADHGLTADGRDLLVTVSAKDKLTGQAFAQVQVAFLNEAGEVVALRHSLAGEVVRLVAGEETKISILDVDVTPFASYEVNILGLTAG